MYRVNAISPEAAQQYAKRIYDNEYSAWGDKDRALSRAGFLTGLTPRSFERLIKGETKDPGIRVFAKIHQAYLNYCSRQIAALQTELEVAKTRYGGTCDLVDLEEEIQALARRVQSAKGGTEPNERTG